MYPRHTIADVRCVRSTIVLLLVVVSGCGGGAGPRERAAFFVQQLAKQQGVRVAAVDCSKLSSGGYGCHARVVHGGTYECEVISTQHGSEGSCFNEPEIQSSP
jgi:hypothetical protein